MSYTVILDNGHGGMINGNYQTPGKRSPNWSKGVLYEGMFNRWVVNRIIEKLDRKNIPYYHISPELNDVSLSTRASRANKIYSSDRNVWLLSIHANAGGGKGVEGFTTKGLTKSDPLMEIVLKNLEQDLQGEQNMRYDWTDGDRDKESNFYILRIPYCPAGLLETGFMDNQSDYNNLWDEKYISKVVDSLVKSIEQIWKN